jgi:hypothetical protein
VELSAIVAIIIVIVAIPVIIWLIWLTDKMYSNEMKNIASGFPGADKALQNDTDTGHTHGH